MNQDMNQDNYKNDSETEQCQDSYYESYRNRDNSEYSHALLLERCIQSYPNSFIPYYENIYPDIIKDENCNEINTTEEFFRNKFSPAFYVIEKSSLLKLDIKNKFFNVTSGHISFDVSINPAVAPSNESIDIIGSKLNILFGDGSEQGTNTEFHMAKRLYDYNSRINYYNQNYFEYTINSQNCISGCNSPITVGTVVSPNWRNIVIDIDSTNFAINNNLYRNSSTGYATSINRTNTPRAANKEYNIPVYSMYMSLEKSTSNLYKWSNMISSTDQYCAVEELPGGATQSSNNVVSMFNYKY